MHSMGKVLNAPTVCLKTLKVVNVMFCVFYQVETIKSMEDPHRFVAHTRGS